MKARIIVIADAHLDGSDDELESFLAFLSFLQAQKIHTFFVLGDLFNIWIGTSKMQFPHQRPVIDALNSLRNHNICVKYIEGNRDYFLSPLYLDAPFHEIDSKALRETIGGQWFYFSHGDLVNLHDRQYRLWREFSRNRLIFSAFNHLPKALATRFVHYLEQKFRGTNLKNKVAFPTEVCYEYATKIWRAGNDVIILGHFHEQRRHDCRIEGQLKQLYVLPAWKNTHTYLRISEQGGVSFCQFVRS